MWVQQQLGILQGDFQLGVHIKFRIFNLILLMRRVFIFLYCGVVFCCSNYFFMTFGEAWVTIECCISTSSLVTRSRTSRNMIDFSHQVISRDGVTSEVQVEAKSKTFTKVAAGSSSFSAAIRWRVSFVLGTSTFAASIVCWIAASISCSTWGEPSWYSAASVETSTST